MRSVSHRAAEVLDLHRQALVRQRVRRWGAILWPSFLIAGLATGVFFANIDPEELRVATFPQLEISRELGYTLGFFMFWAVAGAASLLTNILLCTPDCPWQQLAKKPDEQR